LINNLFIYWLHVLKMAFFYSLNLGDKRKLFFNSHSNQGREAEKKEEEEFLLAIKLFLPVLS